MGRARIAILIPAAIVLTPAGAELAPPAATMEGAGEP